MLCCVVMLPLTCHRQRETHPVQEVKRSRQVHLSMSFAEKVIGGHWRTGEPAADGEQVLQSCICEILNNTQRLHKYSVML